MKSNSYYILIVFLLSSLFCFSSCSSNKKEEDKAKEAERIKKQEQLFESAVFAWENLQDVYKRRTDLIPNLVIMVKGYASHEKEALEDVVNAHAKATSINVNADDLTPEKLQQFQQAQGELSQALSRLIAVIEAYPELKVNENFMDLLTLLEGTENRINETRYRYNNCVEQYNETHPSRLLPSLNRTN